MRNESLMWKKVRPILLAARLDPVRVENPIHPGTPDVNLICGWIELKCLQRWPIRDSSYVRIPHFTPQQRCWLYRRWKYSPGSVFLLMEVQSEGQWLLFDGDVAAKVVGCSTTAEHQAKARVVLGVKELGRLPSIITSIKANKPNITNIPVERTSGL